MFHNEDNDVLVYMQNINVIIKSYVVLKVITYYLEINTSIRPGVG